MRLLCAIWIAFVLSAASCSSPRPSERFLAAPMSIGSAGEGQAEVQPLRMRPSDLYNLFDQNVKNKKWKKIHENAWVLEVNGRDPVSGRTNRLTITLSLVPDLNNSVVVTEIRESGIPFPPEETTRMIRQLDTAFNSGR